MSFGPIAIVGQSCVLPGALRPQELWAHVAEGHDLLAPAPPGRWRIDRDLVLRAGAGPAIDATWSDRGGYVEGFETVFDPTGFKLPAEEILALDPLFQWLLHAGREALRDAGHVGPKGAERIGAVIGNLSFPSSALSALAESVWLEGQVPPGAWAVHPLNRFMSGLPAHLLAKGLGLGAGAFALDAACASSLYAIKLACDRLHDGQADLMLAGAVSRADDLFIHVGFCALQAMSRSGRSRPFHREADGLVPAEGAALVLLKRLSDAVSAGDRILGVIRGVGLSNDGRGANMLAPALEGQARAMRRAYTESGLRPTDISLLECHATGTSVGDATEVRSTTEVFEGVRELPIGSIKSNLGHLITTAGAAALLKVIGAMAAGTRPPTLHADAPLEEIARSPLRLLTAAEPWQVDGPRRAGVSAFGFGGNNAHLILEEPGDVGLARARVCVARSASSEDTIAIVGMGAVVADGENASDFSRDLFLRRSRVRERPGAPEAGFAEWVELEAAGLRFPPRDLERTLPQQILALKAAREAVAEAGGLPRETTAVLMGMQCDAEIARYGARWRVAQWARDRGHADGWTDRAREAFCAPLEAPGVVGSMPNIVTNRLNSQLDLGGPSCSISSEELSGIVALELAARALREREIDAALVGAVDVCAEPVHEHAARRALGPERQPAGDAAVVLVLKRLDDAQRDGNRIYGVLPPAQPESAELAFGDGPNALGLGPLFGHAHAASGLLHVAAAALACRHAARASDTASEPASPWLPGPDGRAARVSVAALGGQAREVWLAGHGSGVPLVLGPVPRLHVFSGADRAEVRRRLEQRSESREGPCRLALVAAGDEELEERFRRAQRLLADGETPGEGVYFREQPLAGELGFVFTGPAGAYRGMGSELLLRLPQLAERLFERFSRLREAAGWVYAGPAAEPTPADKLWGSSFLCQIHAELTRGVMGLSPAAAIGFCSGETNALFALGAWRDIDDLYEQIEQAEIYSRELAGEFSLLTRAWGRGPDDPVRWANWRLMAPLDRVRSAIAGEERVHVTTINAPGDVVIGGEADACERVVRDLGSERARPLGYDIVVHCPEMELFRETWRRIHHRPTFPVPGVRFYAHATGSHYQPTAETAADALVGQAVQTVDFPGLIENAWRDGVRVFLEHGPLGGCSRWIQRTLGEREHLAVPLDLTGRSSLTQVVHAAAQLIVAGVAVDETALGRALGWDAAQARGAPERAALPLRFPVHRPRPRLPEHAPHEEPAGAQLMPPAPLLPPILGDIAQAPPRPPVKAPSPAPRAGLTAANASPRSAALERLVAEQARLVAVHKQFVTHQTEMHRRFLELASRPPVAGTGAVSERKVATATAPVPAARVATPAAANRAEVAPAPRPASAAPRWSRAELETLASGQISSVFGPLFEKQDGYRRQVRMPEPPLLLADRVMAIEGEPGAMGLGTIWTETDVQPGSWYLHDGRMPAGLMIESGQADLLLISWLGIDFLNRGERVYRLLGCELTYHGGLALPGETLCYDIHVDAHARQDEVRLFFFHYECRVDEIPRLTVRGGQAGFFTDEELAATAGVLWDPLSEELPPDGRLDSPAATSVRPELSGTQLRAISEGRLLEAFGPGFERTETHVETPRIAAGRLLLLGEVDALDAAGGPWRRGYLRARWDFSPDDWFFEGHFKNDPCMPGTLMFEGCLQAMAVYLMALGFTLDKDGWRFEPVPDETYRLRCRGQAIPSSRELVYELFVRELQAEPVPTLYADLLCTVDGVKAFHCHRMGLRLTPDWPLTRRPQLKEASAREAEPAAVAGGHRLDRTALLACAWGAPSEAFGELYAAFDGPRRLPRLPSPPYQFLSRITRFEGELGAMKPGAVVEAEYDVPADAWYFAENGYPTMPFCVLLEAHLQPCGWLALAAGVPRVTEEGLFFRNLDGQGTLLCEILPKAARLETRTRLTDVSGSGGMYLVSFEVEGRLQDELVFRMTTGFGFFPEAALAKQVGLPRGEQEGKWSSEGAAAFDLGGLLAQADVERPAPAGQRLGMLDRVTGYWPTAGQAGLGRLRAEKDVSASQWFFKAHFYQDPVQPGSLGLEAMIQLLQVYMLERGLDRDIPSPRFEPLALDELLTWKYRGQVLPTHRRVTIELEVLETGRDDRGAFALADAWLWVDGTRIYSAHRLGMRIVPSRPPK